MRAVVTVGILVAMMLSGCLSPDEFSVDSASEQLDALPVEPELPERFFEPDVLLETPETEVEKGAAPVVSFAITDLHDYPFPVTFIDWALFHDRNPNPVAEGDATDLPGTFNQTLFAPGYHMYGFRADDTQGLNETRILTLSVGEHEDELPSEYQIAHFRWRIDSFFGDAGIEPLPPVGEEAVGVVEEALGTVTNVHSAYLADGCYQCVDASTDAWGVEATGYLGARGCAGYMTMHAGMECAWVPINPASWGETFTVQSDIAGSAGSVDVEFMAHCRSITSVSQEFIQPGGTAPVTGIIPEGAGCMVAFEFHWPSAPNGHTIFFEWDERGGDPATEIVQNLYQSVNTCGVVGCAPPDCMEEGINGLGCVWFPVTEIMWGRPFTVAATPGYPPVGAGTGLAPGHIGTDPDAKALDSCSAEANVVGSFGAGGSETGVIPPGTTCMMAYEWTGNPGLIRFTVHTPA